MKNKIKTVIFDFNGVFVDDIGVLLLKKFCKKYKANIAYVITRYLAKYKQYEEGKLNTHQFWQYVFNKKIDKQEFEKDFERELRNLKPRKNIFSLVKKLKEKGIKVALLSNSNELQSKVFKDLGYFKEFDFVFLSDEIGMTKPWPKTYHFVLKKTKTKPKETLFIDDRKRNIYIAKLLGINTILFKNEKQFFKELKKYIDVDV